MSGETWLNPSWVQVGDAMYLEPSVFERGARAIAQSVKRSAERSARRKSTRVRSAMPLLTSSCKLFDRD